MSVKSSSDACRSWWRHQIETFSAMLAICAGNSPVTNSPRKGQCRGELWAWINHWVNNGEADDLKRHCVHYDITVMLYKTPLVFSNCYHHSLPYESRDITFLWRHVLGVTHTFSHVSTTNMCNKIFFVKSRLWIILGCITWQRYKIHHLKKTPKCAKYDQHCHQWFSECAMRSNCMCICHVHA